jgi:hypothetical protein
MTQSGCKKLEEKMTKIIGQITVIAVVLIISIKIYNPKRGNEYIDPNSYPTLAADYILENIDIPNMRLYNEYNYGSYLLYRGIPVFIDSRADLYTEEFNPGFNIFKDFLDISGLGTTNVLEKIEEYRITHLIMYSNAKLRILLNENADRYMQIYEDDRFVIYERL